MLAATGDAFTDGAGAGAEGCEIPQCRLECGQYGCFGVCMNGTCTCDCQP